MVAMVVVVVGAEGRGNGTPEEATAAGQAEPGTGPVVGQQFGGGGEVCLCIPPLSAVVTIPGTGLTFPVQLVTSRLYMGPTHASVVTAATS